MELGLLKPIISFCCDLKLMQYTGGWADWKVPAAANGELELRKRAFPPPLSPYCMHPAAGLHKLFFLAF